MRVRQIVIFSSLALTLSACISNPNTLGLGAIGAAGGGYAGSLFGKGQGKVLATAGGTALGGLIGAFVGQSFDQTNHNARAINTLYQRQEQTPAPMIYQMPATPNQSTYAVPMNCQVINNYVRCNGSN